MDDQTLERIKEIYFDLAIDDDFEFGEEKVTGYELLRLDIEIDRNIILKKHEEELIETKEILFTIVKLLNHLNSRRM